MIVCARATSMRPLEPLMKSPCRSSRARSQPGDLPRNQLVEERLFNMEVFRHPVIRTTHAADVRVPVRVGQVSYAEYSVVSIALPAIAGHLIWETCSSRRRLA